MWSTIHGLLMLALTGALPPPAVAEHLPDIAHALFVGFGDDPEARPGLDHGRLAATSGDSVNDSAWSTARNRSR